MQAGTLFEPNSWEPYSSSEKERKFSRRLFTSSIKSEIRHFPVVVVQWWQRNVQKAWCTCRVVFLPCKAISFLTVSLSSPSWHLKVMLHGTICNQLHSVAMLEQCCNHSKQCSNNGVVLCCAENRRCKSSRVTSPFKSLKSEKGSLLRLFSKGRGRLYPQAGFFLLLHINFIWPSLRTQT